MSPQRPRSALPLLLSVVVVDLVGFGIVVPILPFVARELEATGVELGLLLTGYAAAQFAFAPIWGRLSDRFGRRPVLLLTVTGTSLSLALLGWAQSLEWMLVARILGGAFAANVSVAAAYITDATEEDERTRWMGLLGASFGIGFTIGPALGGALAPWGLSVPLFAAAGLAAVNAVYAFFVLEEPPGRKPPEPGAARLSRGAVLRDPGVLRLCAIYFVFSLAVTQLETIFPFFMNDRFGYDATRVAFILVAMAVVMGGVQGGGMRALAARFQERSLVIGGSLALGAAFLMVASAPSVAVLLAPLGLAAIGRAVAQPSLMGLVSFTADAERRGMVMGTFQSSASLARVVGPLVAGGLYDAAPGSPFVLAGLLALAVAAAGTRLPDRPEARPTPTSPPPGPAG
jgi:multidrug resistance protein